MKLLPIIVATAKQKGVLVRKMKTPVLITNKLSTYFCLYCQCTVSGEHFHFFKTKSMIDKSVGVFGGY